MRARGLRRLAVARGRRSRRSPSCGRSSSRSRATAATRCASRSRKQAGVGEIGDILDRRGVVPSGALFELRARLAGRQRRPQAGRLHAAQAHALRRRARRARRRAREERRPAHDPGGPEPRARSRRSRAGRACAATTSPRARTASALAPTGVRARRGRREPRGLPLPGHLRAAPRRRGAQSLVEKQLGRVRAELRRRRPLLREAQEPDALRRAHDRLDGRARDAAWRASGRWSRP